MEETGKMIAMLFFSLMLIIATIVIGTAYLVVSIIRIFKGDMRPKGGRKL